MRKGYFVIKFSDGTYYKDQGKTRDKTAALKFSSERCYGCPSRDDALQLIGIMADRTAKLVPAY